MKRELVAAAGPRKMNSIDQHGLSAPDAVLSARPVNMILFAIRDINQEIVIDSLEFRMAAEFAVVFADNAVGSPGTRQFV